MIITTNNNDSIAHFHHIIVITNNNNNKIHAYAGQQNSYYVYALHMYVVTSSCRMRRQGTMFTPRFSTQLGFPVQFLSLARWLDGTGAFLIYS
jgi:hypothetical protein